MKRRRWWFIVLALALLAACVAATLLTYDVDFVPDIVAGHEFRKVKDTDLGYATLVSYTSDQPYEAIRADALREFAAKGYTAEENENGGVIFVRAKMIKAVLLPGMRYDAHGDLQTDPKSTSMWTAASSNFWTRIQQRLGLRLQ